MNSWQRGGVIWTMMTTATTTEKRRVDFEDNDDNDDGNNDHKDDDNNDTSTTSTSLFDITTNPWLDAFLEGRGGDFNNDDNGNITAY